jgi:hypothetical protein
VVPPLEIGPCATDDRTMARYEVVARAQIGRHLPSPDSIDMTLKTHSLDKGMRFRRVDTLPDGQIAVVLQQRARPRRTDEVCAMAQRSLATLGVPAGSIYQLDLHRLSRKGRTLVRSWVGPGGPAGPGPAGVREPRKPLPNPPHLRAALDLPHT